MRFSRFSFRLNLWYASIFILSALLLFFAAYFLLGTALQRKDREVIESRLKEYGAIYQSSGIPALRAWIARSGDAQSERPLFVRVVSPLNQVLFLTAPQEWIEFEPPTFDFGIPRQVAWLRIPRTAERDLVLAAMRFPDGSIMQVGRSTNSRELILDPFRRTFFFLTLAIVVLGCIGGAFFARRVMRPVRQIVTTTQSIIRTGDLSRRVPLRASEDELDQMAELFNQLLAKNQSLIQAMRQSLDNVAHDLRTPLARLRGMAEVALRANDDPAQMRDALADCIEESDKVLTMLKTLMDVAEAESGLMNLTREKTDLRDIIREVVDLYSDVAEEKKITVTAQLNEPCEALVDRIRIRQAFANLLDNAIKYTDPDGRVEIVARKTSNEGFVHFRDNGMGIPPHELDKIWDRLYRGDKSRSQRGLGLGLSLVKAFVEAHRGRVEVQSRVGAGSEFIVQLPVA
jgi:signal transduction histidine kinase